jgi:RHS repeat-associated protein
LTLALVAVAAAPAVAQTEAVEYYGLDALGSVRAIFDQNGQPIERMDYGPFGENLKSAIKMSFEQYAQLARDADTGQDYAQARNYTAVTGRFNAPDPIYAGLLNPQQWNRYGYALNNPMAFVDPNGLMAQGILKCTSTETQIEMSIYTSVDCREWVTFNWEPGGGGGSGGGYSQQGSDDPGRGRGRGRTSGQPGTTGQPGTGSTGGTGGTGSTGGTTTTGIGDEPPPVSGFGNYVLDRIIGGFKAMMPCGGGAFGFAGVGFHAGAAEAEVLALVNYDSADGGSHGGLVAGGLGGVLWGREWMRNWNDWSQHSSPIGLAGRETKSAGNSLIKPGTEMGAGALYQPHGDGSQSLGLWGSIKAGGVGAYVTTGNCN